VKKASNCYQATALLDSAKKVAATRTADRGTLETARPVTIVFEPKAHIAVWTPGGQYCHLIARKVRDLPQNRLGVYAEFRPQRNSRRRTCLRARSSSFPRPSSVVRPPGAPHRPAICNIWAFRWLGIW